MKNIYRNTLTLPVLLASLAFVSSPAFAGKDDIQSRMSQEVFKLQQQAKAAQVGQQDLANTKVVECKRLVAQGKKC